jgi:hypothetical protein
MILIDSCFDFTCSTRALAHPSLRNFHFLELGRFQTSNGFQESHQILGF